MIVTLGDLLLDVIVRLQQPLAEGADADADHAARAGRPGRERGGVGGRARRPRALRRQAAPTTRRAESRARGLERLRRRGSRAGRRRAAPGPSSRSSAAGRRAARWPPTAASHPTCAPTSSTRPGSTGCTHLHLPGYSLLRSPIDGAALRGGRARAAPQRRPLLLERDPRVRRRAVPRAARVAPAGDRLRERGRGADPRRPARGLHVDPQARPARRALRRRRAAGARRPRSSTRPAPATRSPRATSSAGRSSRWTRRHAASRS